MGKYSKQFNQDNKILKNLLHDYHKCWLIFVSIREQIQYGQHEEATRSALTHIDVINDHKRECLKRSVRIQKLFLRKWQKKYGKVTEFPYQFMTDDLQKIVRAVNTRRMYLKQNNLE